jgi:hypothetical protein
MVMGSDKEAKASSSQNMDMSIAGKLLLRSLSALTFMISISSYVFPFFIRKIIRELNCYEFYVDLNLLDFPCKQIHDLTAKENFQF